MKFQYNYNIYIKNYNNTEYLHDKIQTINDVGEHMVYEVGTRIKELREACKWSQKDLGDRINKSVATISSYEQNSQVPPTDVLASLAEVFHVSLDFLAGFNHETVYTTAGLTPDEKEIANLLFTEFSAPSGTEEGLSERQAQIISKIALYFVQRNKEHT